MNLNSLSDQTQNAENEFQLIEEGLLKCAEIVELDWFLLKSKLIQQKEFLNQKEFNINDDFSFEIDSDENEKQLIKVCFNLEEDDLLLADIEQIIENYQNIFKIIINLK